MTRYCKNTMSKSQRIKSILIFLSCHQNQSAELTLCPSPSQESSAWLATLDRKWSKHCSVSLLQAGSRQMSNCRAACRSVPLRAAQRPDGQTYRRSVCDDKWNRRRVLTCAADESIIKLSGEQRIRKISQKHLQQSRHVMNAVLLFQMHIHTFIKLLTQLTHTTTTMITLFSNIAHNGFEKLKYQL